MNNGLLFNVSKNAHAARTLGIYRIAHYLREQNLKIEVIDYATFWSLDELKALFRSRYNKNLSFVGFSQLFSETWSTTLEQFCQWIKNNYSHIKIISGSAANPMFDSNYIDYHIRGYGEYAVDALLKYIISNGPAPKFNVLSGNKKVIDAIHFYPAFPMKSLMVKYQDNDFIEPHEWLGVEFSRGCKFKCHFCNFPVLGVKDDYTRDADDFQEQVLDAYNRFGVSNYYVSDETFNDRTEKITKFADVVERLSFSPWFTGYIRADLLIARPKDREELLRMNFLGHYYGVETFNTDSGKAIGKGMNADRLLAGLIDIKNLFKTYNAQQYRGTIGIIAGLPHETIDSLEFTKKWLINNWNDQAFIAFFLMIPERIETQASMISLDYKKYGYRKMSQKIIDAGALVTTNHIDTLMWENSNMNIFDADRFVAELVELKNKNNFTVDSYALTEQINKPLTISERLKITYPEWTLIRSSAHIKTYIHKKLSV